METNEYLLLLSYACLIAERIRPKRKDQIPYEIFGLPNKHKDKELDF